MVTQKNLWLIEDNCDALGSSYSMPAQKAKNLGIFNTTPGIELNHSDSISRWTGTWVGAEPAYRPGGSPQAWRGLASLGSRHPHRHLPVVHPGDGLAEPHSRLDGERALQGGPPPPKEAGRVVRGRRLGGGEGVHLHELGPR